MKKALLALVVLLVLGGGGAGAYFYFQQPANAASDASGKHEKASEAAYDEDSHKNKFVELAPLVLPIIDESGLNQVVSLVVVIEVSNDKKAAKVESLAPRLKDAYIQDMYGILNKHAALRGGVVQVGPIKARLNRISNRVLGSDVVEDVLLQVVQQRPM